MVVQYNYIKQYFKAKAKMTWNLLLNTFLLFSKLRAVYFFQYFVHIPYIVEVTVRSLKYTWISNISIHHYAAMGSLVTTFTDVVGYGPNTKYQAY